MRRPPPSILPRRLLTPPEASILAIQVAANIRDPPEDLIEENRSSRRRRNRRSDEERRIRKNACHWFLVRRPRPRPWLPVRRYDLNLQSSASSYADERPVRLVHDACSCPMSMPYVLDDVTETPK